MTVSYTRRDAQPATTAIAVAEDPALEAVPIESTGVALSAEQKAFREAWLSSRRR
jgi:hypothetical protein